MFDFFEAGLRKGLNGILQKVCKMSCRVQKHYSEQRGVLRQPRPLRKIYISSLQVPDV